jgi:hypothetical protein
MGGKEMEEKEWEERRWRRKSAKNQSAALETSNTYRLLESSSYVLG